MSVNTDPALEKEADEQGKQAAQGKMADVKGKGSGVQREKEDDTEIIIRNKQELKAQYDYLNQYLGLLKTDVDNNRQKWMIHARTMGTYYEEVLSQFKDAMDDQNTYLKNMHELAFSILSLVGGVVLSYTSNVLKTMNFVKGSRNVLLAEAFVDGGGELLKSANSNAWKLQIDYIKDSGGPVGALTYQNSIMNKLAFGFAEIVSNINLIDSLVVSSSEYAYNDLSQSFSYKKLKQHKGTFFNVKAKVDALLTQTRTKLENPPSINKGEFQSEIKKGLYAAWLPSLREKYMARRQRMIDPAPGQSGYGMETYYEKDVKYHSSLCSTIKSDLEKLGIEKEANVDLFWTSRDDVDKLIYWAKNVFKHEYYVK
jgi:hypothetical protein